MGLFDSFYRSFRHNFVDQLPGDSSGLRHPRETRSVCYALVRPDPVAAPELLALSNRLARDIGLDPPWQELRARLSAPDRDELARFLAGNVYDPSWKSYAACYGGHQFGNWAGQLGDGRAITLGERVGNGSGATGSWPFWEFQWKGGGLTPYSRRADGRAVLRSSLREFVASEAMNALGVPTTRALGLVSTGEGVWRDMLYDGNARAEPGAIVMRVAPSFLRFGNFEILADRDEYALLHQLMGWFFSRFGARWQHDSQQQFTQQVATYFQWICERSLDMVMDWMRVGFVHGVMNTDNMSALGLTIDYGPYGFLEPYDPYWTPNTTDLPGRRYCYGRQPLILHWNLAQLGNALASALSPQESSLAPALLASLDWYEKTMPKRYQQMWAAKLGLPSERLISHDELLGELVQVLSTTQADNTLFFRKLADWLQTANGFGGDREKILDSEIEQYFSMAVYAPWSENVSLALKSFLILWGRLLCEITPDLLRLPKKRRELAAAMNWVNPAFVPRNYLLYEVIQQLESQISSRDSSKALDTSCLDLSELDELLTVAESPYAELSGRSRYYQKRPAWAATQPGSSTLSCSS